MPRCSSSVRNHETFRLYRVDQDENPELAQQFHVERVPTLYVVEGKTVRATLVEPRGCREIQRFLSPWLSLANGTFSATVKASPPEDARRFERRRQPRMPGDQESARLDAAEPVGPPRHGPSTFKCLQRATDRGGECGDR